MGCLCLQGSRVKRQRTLWRSRSCLMKVDLPASAAPIRRMSISSVSTNRVSWDVQCKLHVFLQRVFVWRALRFLAAPYFCPSPLSRELHNAQASCIRDIEGRKRERGQRKRATLALVRGSGPQINTTPQNCAPLSLLPLRITVHYTVLYNLDLNST